MVALLREQVRACSLYTSSTLEEKHCCGYYSREGDRWKFEKQIKNRTLYTWRLFLLIRPFQYISNWLKVFEHLPSLISQSICSNNFFKFCYIINFSVDYTNLHLNSANTSLLIIASTPSTLKLLIKSHPSSRLQFFFWCSFSIKWPWLQRRRNKTNTILHDRYYLQNCKVITFEKLQVIQNVKNVMFQVMFIFSDWTLMKKIIVSFTHLNCWGKQIFGRMRPEGMSNLLLPTTWWQQLGVSFEWGSAWVKMPRINSFLRNMNSINLNIFLSHGEI